MLETRPFGEIYFHFCPASGKGYIGQTTQGCVQRWNEHVRHSRSIKCLDFWYPFSRAIRKYGAEAFESQVLAVARSKEELDGLERLWIWVLRTREDGYNLALGGEGNPGLAHTPEAKEKISRNRKGKGIGNTNALGTVRSEEQKVKDRFQNLGKKFSSEHNEKIRKARTGVPRPDVSAWNNKRWADPAAHTRASALAKQQRAREIAEKLDV